MKRISIKVIILTLLMGSIVNLFADTIEEGDDIYFFTKTIYFDRIVNAERNRKFIIRATVERVTKKKVKIVADAAWLQMCNDMKNFVIANNSDYISYASQRVFGGYDYYNGISKSKSK